MSKSYQSSDQSTSSPHTARDHTQGEIPKNTTYERALSAFFADQAPTEEQRQLLPDDVDGLSARRQALIKELLDSEDSGEQLRLVKQLRLRYGLSSDIRVIILALTTEDEGLAIEALKLLRPWLEARGEESAESMRSNLDSWRGTLSQKVETLLLRSFNPRIQELAAQCHRLLL